MSKSVLAFIAVIALSVQASAQDTSHAPSLEVTSGNTRVSLDASKQVTVKFWLQQLMLSALYRDVVLDSSVEEWQLQLSAPTRVHCRYSSVTALAIPERDALSFEEALLPLPSDRVPGYIYVRQSGKVRRLGKYDPWVLRKLVSEVGLSLYEDLASVERTLF